jgi:hypothetical protein
MKSPKAEPESAPTSTPAPRSTPARKYTRPRSFISWGGLLLGVLLGVAAGISYAWVIDPVQEFDTEPWQLRNDDRARYMVAIMLNYSYDSDLDQAINRLLGMRIEGDPIQAVADTACDLATTGYVENDSGLRAIRAMMQFYQLQGKSGCADTLIPAAGPEPTTVVDVLIATATLVPPASKTPTQSPPDRASPTLVRIIVPTSPPQSDYIIVNAATFCDADLSGLIEVYVQDSNGEGISGEQVRVRWDDGEDRFFTGLKPERGPGYSDFRMESGKEYVVDMPGLADPTERPLSAVDCSTPDGDRAVTSYRVVFRPLN